MLTGTVTPTAIMVGTGKAAQFGILNKNPLKALKTARYSIDTVVLDSKQELAQKASLELVSAQAFGDFDVSGA